MENIIYEKDYTESEAFTASESWSVEIWNQAMNGPFIKSYTAAMDAIPKVIVPEYKENYEYLLRMRDDLAERRGGSIRGVVDYQKWDATIDLYLPYAEFNGPADLKLLSEIAEKSHTVNFKAAEDGGIHIFIFNRYFEELMNEAHRSYIQYDAIMQDQKLAEMLGMSTELPPDLEKFAEHLNPLLDVAEQVSGKDRTDIFLRLLPLLKKIIDEPDSFDEEMDKFMQDLANSSVDDEKAEDDGC